jgi:rubredoxin
MENQSTKYGNVQKCPQCGAPVEPMAVKCSTCGYEFRNVEALKSSQVLAAKLEEINHRYHDSKENDWEFKRDCAEADMVRAFPVPTTKEDLLDFSISMRQRWISTKGYDCGIPDAYKSKYYECVEKSKILFANDPQFQGIFEQYERDSNKKGCSLFVILAIIATSALFIIC